MDNHESAPRFEDVINSKSCAILNAKAYMSNVSFNGMIVYDIYTNKIEKVVEFPDISLSACSYHGYSFEHKGKIYFCPGGTGKVAHKYDTQSKDIYSIKLPLKYGGVQYSQLIDGVLYLFPNYRDQELLSWNLDTIDDFKEENWWDGTTLKESSSMISGAFDNQQVWTYCFGNNKIIIADCMKKQIREYSIGLVDRKVSCVDYDGEHFWIVFSDCAEIIEYSLESGIEKKIIVDINFAKRWTEPQGIFCIRNRIFVFLYREKCIYIVNKETGKFEELSRFPSDTLYVSDMMWVWHKVIDNKVYFFCLYTSVIIEVNLDDLSVNYISTIVKDSEVYEKYRDTVMSRIVRNELLCEGDWWDWKSNLLSFVNLISKYS